MNQVWQRGILWKNSKNSLSSSHTLPCCSFPIFALESSWIFINHVSLNQGTHQNINAVHPNAPEFTPQNHDPQQYLRGKENGEGCIDHLNRLNVEMDLRMIFGLRDLNKLYNTRNWSDHVSNGFRRTTVLTLPLSQQHFLVVWGREGELVSRHHLQNSKDKRKTLIGFERDQEELSQSKTKRWGYDKHAEDWRP